MDTTADMVGGGQEKALAAWGHQQASWDALNRRLAQKLGRAPQDTLTNTVWKYREKTEKVAALAGSAIRPEGLRPEEWQANLREGTEPAIRYKRVGGPHRPLYLPIREKKTEADTEKIIPPADEGWENDHSLSSLTESQYFQQKQRDLRKSLIRRYPHQAITDRQPLVVEGQAPPLTTEPPAAEEPPDAGFEMVMPLEVAHPRSATVIEGSRCSTAATLSMGGSDVSEAPVGPQVQLGATHLVFEAEPNRLVQSSLRVANVGSTAIFYTWKRLMPENIVPDHHLRPHRFDLSDVMTGVLLPEEDRYFTFSCRHSAPGCYDELWEMETVPKVPASLTLRLRAVVVSRDEDPLHRQQLEAAVATKATTAGLHGFFTQILNRPEDNAFVESEFRQTLRAEDRRAAEAAQTAAAEEAERRERWELRNAGTPFRYSRSLFQQLEALHRNVQQYVATVGPPPGTARGLRSDPDGAKLLPWSGSVNHLAEVIQQVDDTVVRQLLLDALKDILSALQIDHSAHDADSDTVVDAPLSPNVLHRQYTQQVMRTALLDFVDQYVDRSYTLGVQLGLIEDVDIPAVGKKGKGGKKEPRKKPPTVDNKTRKTRREDTPEGDADLRRKLEAEHRERMDQEARWVMEDVMHQFCTQLHAVEGRQEIIAQDLCVTFQDRILAARQLAEEKDKLTREKTDLQEDEKPVVDDKKKKKK
eukprot:GGOE01003247.1.p1 GENE.GGOE01003247.1~~GGOE01003247.1.p1  ORF type:complete len:724 (+),score=248.88 GGOE01003247.1:74-2173(+)